MDAVQLVLPEIHQHTVRWEWDKHDKATTRDGRVKHWRWIHIYLACGCDISLNRLAFVRELHRTFGWDLASTGPWGTGRRLVSEDPDRWETRLSMRVRIASVPGRWRAA